MASLPNVTYDMLKTFYAKYKAKDIEEEFTIIDLEGRQINIGLNTIFQGKNYLDKIIAQKRPVLITNFKIGEVTYSYSFGTYEVRKIDGNIPERHKSIFVFKIFNGTFFLHRGAYGASECEYLMYFPRSGKLNQLFAIHSQSPITVNSAMTFKEGETQEFQWYSNSIRLNQDMVDWGVIPVLKIQLVDDTTGNWVRCITKAREEELVPAVNVGCFKWQDNRNTWSSTVSDYTVYVS